MSRSSKSINWQSKFKTLPEIPVHKKWPENLSRTKEQEIVYKLVNGIFISKEETFIMLDLINYYDELYCKLPDLEYSQFNNEDLNNFQNYIFYAFNYLATISNNYTITSTYRMIVNEHVTGKNESIKDSKFLKYPHLDLVRKIGKYNRSNTPNTHLFYSAENIDTALKEIRPPKNKLVTVGVWAPKVERTFTSYVIFHNDDLIKVNLDASNAMTSFEKQLTDYRPLFLSYMRNYFKLLGREYSKSVNHHYEYIISALFSERIMIKENKFSIDYDCIIYPSVGNNHITSNVAIRPSVLDSAFYLKKVIEFEIDEEYYDQEYIYSGLEDITLAKAKNSKYTNKISEKGKIEW